MIPPAAGQLWILPVDSSDLVPVTDQVLSYERDGALHLADSDGVVTGDGLAYDDPPPDDGSSGPFSS